MKALFAVVIFLTGCEGLKVKCENMNVERLGQTYAHAQIDPRNFDTFQNQCAKYGYKIPSGEKFYASYNEARGVNCQSDRVYFKFAFDTYRKDGFPLGCPDNLPIAKRVSDIRTDASQAAFAAAALYHAKDSHVSSGPSAHNLAEAAILAPIAAVNLIVQGVSQNREKETLRAMADKYGYLESELE